MARFLESVQRDLVVLMGEVATLHADRARYIRAGHRLVCGADVARLTREVHAIEKRGMRDDGWATPGANLSAAALDVARTACRRAERRVVALGEKARRLNPEVVRYLNRLSDLLWLLARWVETHAAGK
ncbi:MAG: ATP:cob(I)alamin adenosyltransferase [Deltaproteobacteria bacterium]